MERQTSISTRSFEISLFILLEEKLCCDFIFCKIFSFPIFKQEEITFFGTGLRKVNSKHFVALQYSSILFYYFFLIITDEYLLEQIAESVGVKRSRTNLPFLFVNKTPWDVKLSACTLSRSKLPSTR